MRVEKPRSLQSNLLIEQNQEHHEKDKTVKSLKISAA